MNISGIRTYAGFYDYNTIKSHEAVNPPQEEIAEVLEPVRESERMPDTSAESKPDGGAMDFAMRYQPDTVYELKGADSDIANLDLERALSEMKKDQVLQQYQFFVGESKAGEVLARNRMNENFFL